MDTRMIHVRRQLDLSTGEITWPKDDDGRWVPMSPGLYAYFQRMPRMGKVVHAELGEIVFPSAVRGGYMPVVLTVERDSRCGGDARPAVL
jgi:hypothetical protein